MTMAMFFDVIFSGLIAFTFLCLAILLIIRYLMLGGLLIILPLAWLTYVFPKFDNSFGKWWNTFVKWVFFPPLALFFIYLAFITATNTNSGAIGVAPGTGGTYLTQAAGLPTGAATGVEGSIYQETGLSGILQQAADEILLVGLTVMGLMFANSLAGKAGSTVVNGATTASKAVAGYVGKKTRAGAQRAGFYGLRTKAGRQVTEALQTAGVGRNLLISGLLRPVRSAGNVIADHHASTEKLVGDRQKELGKKSLEEQARRFGTQDTAGKFAILSSFDKALKGKDSKAEASAEAALQTLPPNITNEMRRLMEPSKKTSEDAPIGQKIKEFHGMMWGNRKRLIN